MKLQLLHLHFGKGGFFHKTIIDTGIAVGLIRFSIKDMLHMSEVRTTLTFD